MRISAPGKLMLSGEWSVLELGVPCIVLAVDKKVFVDIEENDSIIINAKDLDIEGVKANFDEKEKKFEFVDATELQKKRLVFVKNAIDLTLRYLSEKNVSLKNFELSTNSESTIIKGQKVGFGSSAAVTVATVGAVLKFHGQELEKETIYKLGCAAHYFGQGKVGSAFDVAASTYGRALVYKRFDSEWLAKELDSNSIVKVIETGWKDFEAIPIELPENFQLAVGFSGKKASTKELVLKMKEFKQKKTGEYQNIIKQIEETTKRLIFALKQNDKNAVTSLIKNNRTLLKEFGEKSGMNLETKELTELIETGNKAGGASKFSGAGGGDSVISVCFNSETKEKIEKEWKQKGFAPIKIGMEQEGIIHNR